MQPNEDENEVMQMHVIIKGRVQGVGFRATTQFFASQLGINGTVCNLPGGDSVEIYAQGPKHILIQLLSNLKEEFGFGKIADIKVDYQSITHRLDSFKIIN